MTNMNRKINRPGGELASRPLYFYLIVDCSYSMAEEKIGALNNAAQSVIPDMRSAAKENPNTQVYVRTLKFSSGASWVTAEPVKVEEFEWEDLEAMGVTDMGKAFELISAQLEMPPMPERALPPVLVLMSDGMPTDAYKKPLDKLLKMPWGRKAVRIAISIGKDADDSVLAQFTGNPELVFKANNAAMLTKLIKWASTMPSMVSSPASQPEQTPAKDKTPDEKKEEGDKKADKSGETPAQKYLNVVNIPDPEEVDPEDVW